MALFDLKDTAGAMHDVLDRERAAILSGRFDTLERLVPEKERLADRLARKGADHPELDRLRARAERNARLLEAMRNGLNDARAQLNALRGTTQDLQTYDATGRKTNLGAPRPTDRRA